MIPVGALGQCSEFTTSMDLEDCRTPDRVKLEAVLAKAEAEERAYCERQRLKNPWFWTDDEVARNVAHARRCARDREMARQWQASDDDVLDAEAARIRMLLARPQRKKTRQ